MRPPDGPPPPGAAAAAPHPQPPPQRRRGAPRTSDPRGAGGGGDDPGPCRRIERVGHLMPRAAADEFDRIEAKLAPEDRCGIDDLADDVVQAGEPAADDLTDPVRNTEVPGRRPRGRVKG